MTAKSFFKKVGRGLQHASGDFTNAVGKGAGMVIGTAAGKAALEAAPLLMLKTGGKIPGKRNKAVKVIVHGGEYVLPANAKPTKMQRLIVKKNKMKSKK